jgi:hypothetical protein
MKRLLSALGAASAATGLGFVAHQLLAWKDDPPDDQAQQLIVGVPVVPAVIATVFGMIFGSRAAIVIGFFGTALAGTNLDDLLPNVASARQRALEQLRMRGEG